MRTITLVMAYYDNPTMLEMQFDLLRDLPQDIKDHIRLTLVDDCSPNFPARLREGIGIDAQLYRVSVDVRWNQDAARNIGVNHCETDWVLLTDMDHMVSAETWQHLLDPVQHFYTNRVYSFRRVKAPKMEEYKAHPNSWFMATSLFKKIWYDERFAGYYGTDGDFKERGQRIAKFEQLKAQLITVPRDLVPDAATNTYTRKEPWDFENIKRIRAQRLRDGNYNKPKVLTFPYERIA